MSEGHFEAKHYAMRKSKDGTIVSFVVHPSDMTAELNCLPIGARVMIGWSEIGDNEKPVAASSNGKTSDFESENVGSTPTAAVPNDEGARLVQQCAIACSDWRFRHYLQQCGYTVQNETDARNVVCKRLGIASRAELKDNKRAQNEWKLFHAVYQQSQTDLNYGGVRR